jgi:hypothetical protein
MSETPAMQIAVVLIIAERMGRASQSPSSPPGYADFALIAYHFDNAAAMLASCSDRYSIGSGCGP